MKIAVDETNISTKDLSKVAKDIINDCKTFCSDSKELDEFIDNLAKSKIKEVINDLNPSEDENS